VKVILFSSEIDDPMTRRCFQSLEEGLRNEETLKFNFVKVDFTLDAAGTDIVVPHRLGFKPTDIIVTRQTGPGVVTWNYDAFTDKLLNVTTTGQVSVRALVGAYRENQE
jgi:hypothetical protein